MKNKKGFTLVELLAVIAISAILVIIALPNVINMYNKAQKEIFLTETKKIYSEAEKKYISSSINGNTVKKISSEDNSKLNMTGKKLQYCIILNNNGKVNNMKVSNGKWIASLDNNKSIEDLTIDDLEEGNLDDYNCTQNAPNVPKPIYCTFGGDMVRGAEYVNGQYTYRYMQEGGYTDSGLAWQNITSDGWGVQLTDKTSTDSVTSKVCTYINNKPVVSMSYMFYNSQATTLDVSNFNTSKVTSMNDMFSGSQATTLDVSNFDTSNVTGMNGMFYNSKATTLDVSTFDTSKVTNMHYMFYNSKATTLDLSNFNTSNVTDMSYMFSYTQATTLDLSSFNTSKVTNMDYMFFDSKATTLDLSNFNTSNVTGMSFMFSNSKATTLDLSNFNTSNVTNMGYMFSGSQATTLDVSNFDTSKVTYMRDMFYNSKATTLDVSSFDTSNVTNMSNMFNKATNLKTIYVSDKFKTGKVTSSNYMFSGCTALVGGAGTKYDSTKIDKKYAHIDGGTSNPGYFTLKTN